MKITMIGAGYVGLVSGTCFADFGHSVTCVDLDQSKIDALLAGVMPIYEPGLAELVASNVAAGRLSFTTDLKAGVAGADAVFIAVGTPSRRGDGHADLTYVYQATRDIASAITGPLVVARDIAHAKLKERLGLRDYAGTSPTFAPLGDENGLLIVFPVGRNWLSSNIPTAVYPAEVRIRGAAPGKLAVPEAAYQIEVTR